MVGVECGWSRVWLESSVVGVECGWSRVWLESSVVGVECGWSRVWLESSVVGVECGWSLVWLECAVWCAIMLYDSDNNKVKNLECLYFITNNFLVKKERKPSTHVDCNLLVVPLPYVTIILL